MFVPIPTCSKVIPTFLADPVSPSRLSLSLFIVPLCHVCGSRHRKGSFCNLARSVPILASADDLSTLPDTGQEKGKRNPQSDRAAPPIVFVVRAGERCGNLQTCSPTWPHQQFSRLTDTAQDVWSDERGATGKVGLHADMANQSQIGALVLNRDQNERIF